MTCIAGLVHKDTIYMGADSAGTADSRLRTREDPKVFIRDNMIFGFTSSFRMGQLIQYSLKIPDYHKDMTNHEYMATSFVDAVIKCLKDGGYAEKNNDVESGGHFLVGYRNKIYNIQTDYQVAVNTENFNAIGSGDDLALGSLYTTHIFSPETPHTRIRVALRTAENFNAYVRSPFTVLELKNNGK